jgi:fatty-acyl-CoA synthase
MTLRAPQGSLIRDLADIRAIETIPLRHRMRGPILSEFFERLRDEFGHKPALVSLPSGRADDPAEHFSYTELCARILSLANLMRAHGVSPEAPVTLLMPNLPEMHFALWAGAIAGVVNPINPFLDTDQILEIMLAAGSRSIVAPSRALDPALAAKAADVSARIANFGARFFVGRPDAGSGGISLDDADQYAGDRLDFERVIRSDDIALMLHTGGTTGMPKLVQQSHGNQLANAAIAALLLDYRPGDPILTGLPLFHTNATIVTGLAAFSCGAKVVLGGPAGFRSKDMVRDIWRIIERHDITAFCAVPTVLAALLEVPIDGCDISSLRSALCGAAPLAPRLYAEFEQKTGARILEGYGLTEGTALSTLNPRDGERRIGSIGLPVPYQHVVPAIVDDQGNYVRDCTIDEVGSILICGPAVTPGYVSPVHNAGAWPKPGWINTGDLGRVDQDGYLWLAGRAKDIIIRGGHNIDPGIIEDALTRHPAVDLAAGIGYPDAYAGELPAAYVTLKAGHVATPDELREHARARVTERAAAPAFVEVIPAMPMTAVGKIFKPTLREWAAERAVRATLSTDGVEGIRSVAAHHDPSCGLVVRVVVATGSTGAALASSAARLPLRLEIREIATA